MADSFRRAVIDNHLVVVGRILDVDPEQIKSMDDNGWTSLHWAAANSHLEMVELLLSRGADVNARGESLEIPLHVTDCPMLARRLIAAGADPKAKDDWGVTAMDWAARTDDWQLAAVLATSDSVRLQSRQDGAEAQSHRSN